MTELNFEILQKEKEELEKTIIAKLRETKQCDTELPQKVFKAINDDDAHYLFVRLKEINKSLDFLTAEREKVRKIALREEKKKGKEMRKAQVAVWVLERKLRNQEGRAEWAENRKLEKAERAEVRKQRKAKKKKGITVKEFSVHSSEEITNTKR
jgi:hypothetical protein